MGGVLFGFVRGFEQSNAARMSAAGEGSTEPNLYFRKAKMQTTPSHVLLNYSRTLWVVFFWLERDLNNQMQQSGGLLLATARRSETLIFSQGEKMQTNPSHCISI